MITRTRKYQHLNGSNPPIQSRWRYSHGRHQENVSPGVRSTTGSWRIFYLWRPNGDIWTEPKTHQMLVHIFGAKSSPSCILGLLCRQLTQIICQRRTCKRHKKVSRFCLLEEASNSQNGFQTVVLSAFPVGERAPRIKDLDWNPTTYLWIRP